MALWVGISIALACLLIGYALASWAGDASQQDLEQENRLLEIQVASLKRSGH
jgi:hypothetical protein